MLPDGLGNLQESALLGILNGSTSPEQIAIVVRLLEQARMLREEERRSREAERRWSEVQLAILRELKTSDTCGEGFEALLNNHLHSTTSSFAINNNLAACESDVSSLFGDLTSSSPSSAPCSSPSGSLVDAFVSTPLSDSLGSDFNVNINNWDTVLFNNSFNNQSVPMATDAIDQACLDMFAAASSPAPSVASSSPSPLMDVFTGVPMSSPAAASALDDLFIEAILKSQVAACQPMSNSMTIPHVPSVVFKTEAASPAPKKPAQPKVTRTRKTSSASTDPAVSTIPIVSSVHKVSISGQKKVIEEPCACRGCGSPFATMILRGKANAFDSGYIVDVLCNSCSAGAAPAANAAAVVVPSRKRARGRAEESVSCDVCRTHLGCGGVKVDAASRRRRVESPEGSEDGVEVTSSDFSVEVVCVPCREKYAFCSECGGGGKYRTGKYRPIELFQEGRRTCRLSHVRFGDAAVSYRVYDASCPMESTRLTADVVAETKAVFEDGVTSFFASPRVMEHSNRCNSMAGIQQEIASTWQKVDASLSSAVANAAIHNKRRYFSSSYIPRIPRKKTRTTRAIPIAVDHAEETAPPPSAQDHVQAAFISAEFDASRRTLIIDQIGARMMAMQSATLARDLASRCLGRAQRDASVAGSAVEHVCVVVPKGEERLAGFCSKLGAVPVDLYLRRHKIAQHRHVFGFVEEGMDVFVIAASEFA
ncbi:hypothetical protein HDU97_006379 [Phlyctochytrium planicorne]|nr:hypothetical protein HDU97_006379 [Phlyctochytrium planicorne]